MHRNLFTRHVGTRKQNQNKLLSSTTAKENKSCLVEEPRAGQSSSSGEGPKGREKGRISISVASAEQRVLGSCRLPPILYRHRPQRRHDLDEWSIRRRFLKTFRRKGEFSVEKLNLPYSSGPHLGSVTADSTTGHSRDLLHSLHSSKYPP